MPDWSYQPIFRPLLFRLPPEFARDITLGAMGRLGRLPLGGAVISFMGHMQPDGRLKQTHCGIPFPTGVGLGTGIDVNAMALEALSKFGFGFIEVGPVSPTKEPNCSTVERDNDQEAICFIPTQPNIDAETLTNRLRHWDTASMPIIVRLATTEPKPTSSSLDEICHLIEQLSPMATFFSITDADYFLDGTWDAKMWLTYLNQVCDRAGKPILITIPSTISHDRLDALVKICQESQISGYIVDGRLSDKCGFGRDTFDASRAVVQSMRQTLGTDGFIIASGGIHEPAQALAMRKAGASLVQVNSGLVFTGPGLPKRINEATLHAQTEEKSLPDFSFETAAKESWFWTALLGIAMFLGGLLAIIIAATRVILPYDESFVNMTRDELAAINPNLLPFMAHDRITLAGVMVAIGWFYLLLSLFGVRRGHHWAKMTVLYSAVAGFFSFFLFLGFSYFDPFHAFVTVIMFQFTLLALHSTMSTKAHLLGLDLHNDWIWRWSLWGQVLFLIQGIAIFAAGFFISGIGITSVFVAEDLAFMQTTAEALWAANPRLVPLIAHDRATLGGMLIASGIAIILATLWGFRRGEKWLWWGLLLSSLIAYLATLIVHTTVGYTDLLHLSPIFAGSLLTAVGAFLTYPYLWGYSPKKQYRQLG
ncbi:MAG: dihydroorotate dehydrogenase [Chloroflexota bacterium]